MKKFIYILLFLLIPLKYNCISQGDNWLNEENIYTLSAIINAECGICGEEEKYLVGSAVINRVYSNNYPYTIQEVVEAERQFSGYCSPNYYPTETTYRIAIDLMRNIGRDYRVFFFHTHDAPDTTHTNAIEENVIYFKKYHKYATL